MTGRAFGFIFHVVAGCTDIHCGIKFIFHLLRFHRLVTIRATGTHFFEVESVIEAGRGAGIVAVSGERDQSHPKEGDNQGAPEGEFTVHHSPSR